MGPTLPMASYGLGLKMKVVFKLHFVFEVLRLAFVKMGFELFKLRLGKEYCRATTNFARVMWSGDQREENKESRE